MVVTFPPEARPSTFCWPLLHNRYQVLHDLGVHSQCSRVLRVLDTHTGKPFALKQMRMANLAHYEIRQAARFFRQEALILQQVSHPRIPQLHEVWTQGQRWHLVMTFVEGETLETILKREGCLPPSRVLFYAIQLCQVLVYLHQQQQPVIHRDLKPANIIIDPKGDLWLIDFGIARYGQVAQHPQQVLAWRSEPRTVRGAILHHHTLRSL
jgi:serine/threonine protein kinase